MPGPYIPTTDQALDNWAANFAAVITSSPTAYGLVSGDATAFTALQVAYHDAFLVGGTVNRLPVNPATRTPVTVAAKDDAKTAVTFKARQLAQIARKYPNITPDLLAAAGLTVPDPTPTPVPTPTSQPVLSIYSSSPLEIDLRYTDSVLSNPRSKPEGAIGMRVWAKVGTTPPVTVDDCVFMGQFTKMPAPVIFDSGDSGKTAYFIAKWVTRTNKEGPASDIFSATIP